MKKKLHWHSPIISRIKLNPEQAVLACCNATSKIARSAVQCSRACPGGGATSGVST